MTRQTEKIAQSFNCFMGVIDPWIAEIALKNVIEDDRFAPIDHVEKVTAYILQNHISHLSDAQINWAWSLVDACQDIENAAVQEIEQRLRKRHGY